MLPIRRADERDAGEVLTVQRAAFVTEAQLHDDVHLPPLTQTLDGVRAAIATSTVLVAVDGPRIVGTIRAYADGGVWHVGRLAVVPDRQGEGIGSALLAAIEAAAPTGSTGSTLETGPRSVSNIRFYERSGYRQVPNDSILIRLSKSIQPRECTP